MLLDLWIAALRSQCGVAIKTDNRMLLRQHLYKARLEARNPDLEAIVMILPEADDEIWLVHKHANSIGANHQGNVEPL
jgi:hypothetical protein